MLLFSLFLLSCLTAREIFVLTRLVCFTSFCLVISLPCFHPQPTQNHDLVVSLLISKQKEKKLKSISDLGKSSFFFKNSPHLHLGWDFHTLTQDL
jgi:hypothetical protein